MCLAIGLANLTVAARPHLEIILCLYRKDEPNPSQISTLNKTTNNLIETLVSELI